MIATSWSDTLSGLVPFVLLIGFWMFMMRRMRGRSAAQDPVVEQLVEIKEELRRLREAIETSGFRR